MLNRMVTRDVAKIASIASPTVVWCTDEGRMIDDGTIFKLADDKFMLTCGSPCTAWLEKSAFGFDDVSVTDVTDDIAALSLQGPTSCAVLKKMGLDGIETAKPFDIMHFPFHGDTLMVSRTGFTGDLGYELWIPAGPGARDVGRTLCGRRRLRHSALRRSGDQHGAARGRLHHAGMEFNEALRTVNFEHDQTPFELNLGWLVDFNKPHFSGRSALLKEKQRGPKYTLTKARHRR